MRWITYSTDGGERAGLVLGERVHGLPAPYDVLDLIGDEAQLAAAADRATNEPAEIVALDAVHLAPPVRPRAIRDFLAFHGHVRNAMGHGAVLDERHSQFPVFYFSNPAAVIGPHDDVTIAPGSAMFDFELEVAAVIGVPCTNIAPADAERHIAGYTIFCDWSARDLQGREMPLLIGAVKSKDTANTVGPMLVTADELESLRSGNGFALEMRAYVNDELVGKGSLDQLDWSFADMVAYAARGTTLRPGDLIGSGTVPTGCLLEHFVMDATSFRGWLQPGDVVTLSVDQLGETRQRVLPSLPRHPLSTGY